MEKYPADWKKRRRNVFQRDEWACQFCGEQPNAQSTVSFHCHHIKPISKGGGHSYDNLTTVCEDCHYDIHSSDEVQSEYQLKPVKSSVCAYCDEAFGYDKGFAGSFCSQRCACNHRLQKFQHYINHKNNICSACFESQQIESGTCKNCGNFEIDNGDYDVADSDMNTEEALLQMIYWLVYH